MRLNIEIINPKVNKIINNNEKLIKKVGLQLAKRIKQRINEMKATPNFKDYLDYGPGKPHPLSSDLDDLYGVSLTHNVRLIIEPLTEKRDNDSLTECKSINIKGVMDYHGDKKEWLIP